jgi:hypothetical protein
MKKVIALSAVLVFGALGMACDGGAAPNANNGNTKPANLSTPTPAATLAPPTNMNTAPSNMNAKPMNSNTNTDKK